MGTGNVGTVTASIVGAVQKVPGIYVRRYTADEEITVRVSAPEQQ
jgi:hypothetical protein